jgi:hypothetical protein
MQKLTSNGNFDKSQLVQQINANNDEIERLKTENESLATNRDELAKVKAEAGDDDNVETEDYYRIPAIMNDCQSAYDLTWSGDGSWSGYTYTREATAPNINGTIKFEATLSVVRKPSYILGIQVHRAIIKIAWKLSTEYSDRQVVDIVSLSNTVSNQEKATIVNEHISQVAQDYPTCEISTEYLKQDDTESDNSTDTYHLLWSSDRLEIAREIDTRLTHIYADLVSLEKMMNYKLSIVDVLRNISPYVNAEDGRRLTLVEQARRRWLRNAAKTSHSINYNGKYDDEE